ncbi:MAG: hypothetical protein GX270_00810 [Clostridiaceae bacterium]|nr:hypothetical protein [Clostridiaceae bacterium]
MSDDKYTFIHVYTGDTMIEKTEELPLLGLSRLKIVKRDFNSLRLNKGIELFYVALNYIRRYKFNGSI